MTFQDLPLLWCTCLTAILASLGLVAAWLMSRRSPAAAATATASAAATILLVTVLAPVQLPTHKIWRHQQTHDFSVARARAPSVDNAAGDARGVSIDIGNVLAQIIRTARTGTLSDQPFAQSTEAWLMGIFALGATFGLVRLLVSLRYVVRLRRACARVVCEDTWRLFVELNASLHVRRQVTLRESAELDSPAVIGWRRPLILLPADRSGWTREELRAALAHELAHVVRSDFIWRIAATCAQSIHFFHPLVHLLTRRLALAQELATDRLAATAVGGQANYLRALSELAIRLDDRNGLRAEPIVLPAFSSNLVRRIAMLRSKDGTASLGRRPVTGVATAAMIALVGVGAMVLRGSAESIEPATTSSPAAAALFARPALDSSTVGAHDKGLFVVRLGELSQRPAFVPVFKLANRMLSERWLEAFGVAAPVCSFESIEYVAGVPQLTVEPFKNEKDPNVSQRVMIGCQDFVVRFRSEVSWQSWIKTHIPSVEEISEDGSSYMKLPELAFIGPGHLYVAARDRRTLVCTSDLEHLRQLTKGVKPKSDSSVENQWKSIEGGLATFLVTDERINVDMTSIKDPRAIFVKTIFQNSARLGVGFDLDAATNQSSIHVDLKCHDQASAERVRALIATMLPLAKTQLQAMINNQPELVLDGAEREKLNLVAGGPDTDRQVGAFWMDVLSSCNTEIVPHQGREFHVRVSTIAPFPEQIMKAYEVADKSAATDSEKR